jgi:hypothetical protein
MSISRILELAGLSRIDETHFAENEVAKTGGFGFLRSLNEKKDFVCGDGKSFDSEKEAKDHAEKVFKKTGNIISVEAKKKNKVKESSKPSDSETKEASQLEAELTGLKKKKSPTDADKARIARLEKTISGLEKKTRDKNDLKEEETEQNKKAVDYGNYMSRLRAKKRDKDWDVAAADADAEKKNNLKESQGWEILAKHNGVYDQCVHTARIINTTPKVVWEVFNHMHNYDNVSWRQQHGHIPHGNVGVMVADYIHHNWKKDDDVDYSVGETPGYDEPTQNNVGFH